MDQAIKLRREYAVLKGMINEAIMSLTILTNRIEQAKDDSDSIYASAELTKEVTNKMPKFERNLNKYKIRMLQIVEELKDYGINDF